MSRSERPRDNVQKLAHPTRSSVTGKVTTVDTTRYVRRISLCIYFIPRSVRMSATSFVPVKKLNKVENEVSASNCVAENSMANKGVTKSERTSDSSQSLIRRDQVEREVPSIANCFKIAFRL